MSAMRNEQVSELISLKGHITNVSPEISGARYVDFMVRHGGKMRLIIPSRDEELIAQAVELQGSGMCHEVFIEQTNHHDNVQGRLVIIH